MAINVVMANCSGVAIQHAFERVINTQIRYKRLVSRSNYYLDDAISKLDKSSQTLPLPHGKVTLNQLDIEEYIASSIILHSSDGWNFIARSIDSLLNGDIPSSIHFAYYAELRAVMSMMAYEGVGIFNRQHIYFDTTNSPHLFSGKGLTTHGVAEQGIEQWATLPGKKDILFNLIKVKNHSLGDWIRETGFATRAGYSNSMMSSWLKKWSVDLHLQNDQRIRNEMSYRPHITTKKVNLESVLPKITDLWNLLEPTASNGFPLLDQHLLRKALEGVYSAGSGKKAHGIEYRAFLIRLFNRIGEPQDQSLFTFLLRETNPLDASIFVDAKKDRSGSKVNKNDPMPIISRAILMLRLSTGGASNLIDNSSLDKRKLRFWWEKLSVENGILNTVNSGLDPIDLFADIRESLDELSEQPSGSFENIKDAFLSLSTSLFHLKQFQRPAIWGLGL